MKRWQIFIGILLGIWLVFGAMTVSADDKCYDDKGNPIPCPPTKEEPPTKEPPTKAPPTAAGGNNSKPSSTPSPIATASTTPTPTATVAQPIAPTPTLTFAPIATFTQTPSISAYFITPTTAVAQVFVPPPPVPCIPWLWIVLGGVAGILASAMLALANRYTLFFPHGTPARATLTIPRDTRRLSWPRWWSPLPRFTLDISFRAGLLVTSVLLSASGLAGINSLIPCNSWPAATGTSLGIGLMVGLLLRSLWRILGFTLDGPGTDINVEEVDLDTEKLDKG